MYVFGVRFVIRVLLNAEGSEEVGDEGEDIEEGKKGNGSDEDDDDGDEDDDDGNEESREGTSVGP